jgi:hypothetical protein
MHALQSQHTAADCVPLWGTLSHFTKEENAGPCYVLCLVLRTPGLHALDSQLGGSVCSWGVAGHLEWHEGDVMTHAGQQDWVLPRLPGWFVLTGAHLSDEWL